jgi:hypothetical protein
MTVGAGGRDPRNKPSPKEKQSSRFSDRSTLMCRTKGSKREILMLLVKTSVAAIFICLLALVASGNTCTAANLDGTWELSAIGSQPVRKGSVDLPYFNVTGDLIRGFDGCNQFSGRLDQSLEIAATRRGCAEGAVRLPLDLSNAAAHLRTAKISETHLELPARGPFPASVFIRIKN